MRKKAVVEEITDATAVEETGTESSLEEMSAKVERLKAEERIQRQTACADEIQLVLEKYRLRLSVAPPRLEVDPQSHQILAHAGDLVLTEIT